MHLVVAPVFHEYCGYPVGRQSCVELPAQKEVLPVMVQFKLEPTVTVLLQLDVQPPLETVTEYVPVAPTVIQRVVSPVLHAYDDIPDGAQSEVVPPLHIEPFPVIEQLIEPVVTVLLHVTKQPLIQTVTL
jgi:hypothetical protein